MYISWAESKIGVTFFVLYEVTTILCSANDMYICKNGSQVLGDILRLECKILTRCICAACKELVRIETAKIYAVVPYNQEKIKFNQSS